MELNKLGEEMPPRENQYITEVTIRAFKYELWQLNDREPHDIGTMNGESGTLWIRQIGDGPHKEQEGEDSWIPWLDISANRDCWEITIKDGNSMKYKHTDYRIDKHTAVYIKLNGSSVYEIMGRDFDWCYNEARSKIYNLRELMYTFEVNLKNTSEEKDRKIYYKGMPSTIEIIFVNGSMTINPDYTDIDKDYWWDQIKEPWHDKHNYESIKLDKKNNGIVVDILSNDIHWTRNDRAVKLNKIKRSVNEKKGTS